MEKEIYKQCSKCILDTNDDAAITIDSNGICNYCHSYDKGLKLNVCEGKEGEKKIAEILMLLKNAGKGKKYDCIMGVSGGVDSTYLALWAKKNGLRPLAVHFDNGWNSELAVKNIENILEKLNIDLYTYVVDWEEFKDVQLAYLKASVVDVEIPTDHAFVAVLYKVAAENKIKYILSGHNYVTESILPRHWIYEKGDDVNIGAIHEKFGTVKLKTFPFLTIVQRFYYMNVLKLRNLYPLNYIHYNKKEVKKIIKEELAWKDYGGKHYESIFTRFYQGYILPEKFKIDKRRAHLSNLICSGQISREEALEEIKQPIYDPEQLKQDKEFVIKKFGLSNQEFEDFMSLPVRQHTEFATNKKSNEIYMGLLKKLSPLSRLVKLLGHK